MKLRRLPGPVLLLVMFSAISAAGCTSLSLKAERVRLTEIDSDITDCKLIGDIQVSGSVKVPGQGTVELRNKAAAMGADVVLYNSPIVGNTSGKAYNCGGRYAKVK